MTVYKFCCSFFLLLHIFAFALCENYMYALRTKWLAIYINAYLSHHFTVLCCVTALAALINSPHYNFTFSTSMLYLLFINVLPLLNLASDTERQCLHGRRHRVLRKVNLCSNFHFCKLSKWKKNIYIMNKL